MSPELQSRIEAFRMIGDPLCQSLCDCLRNMGMERRWLPRIALDELSYSAQHDPYSGETTLHGEWRDVGGPLRGSLDYRADGTLYLEYDVLQPHPTDKRWIIEAITAWGSVDNLKVEPRLMAAVEEE